jgi:hypothetical protein
MKGGRNHNVQHWKQRIREIREAAASVAADVLGGV